MRTTVCFTQQALPPVEPWRGCSPGPCGEGGVRDHRDVSQNPCCGQHSPRPQPLCSMTAPQFTPRPRFLWAVSSQWRCTAGPFLWGRERLWQKILAWESYISLAETLWKCGILRPLQCCLPSFPRAFFWVRCVSLSGTSQPSPAFFLRHFPQLLASLIWSRYLLLASELTQVGRNLLTL